MLGVSPQASWLRLTRVHNANRLGLVALRQDRPRQPPKGAPHVEAEPGNQDHGKRAVSTMNRAVGRRTALNEMPKSKPGLDACHVEQEDGNKKDGGWQRDVGVVAKEHPAEPRHGDEKHGAANSLKSAQTNQAAPRYRAQRRAQARL